MGAHVQGCLNIWVQGHMAMWYGCTWVRGHAGCVGTLMQVPKGAQVHGHTRAQRCRAHGYTHAHRYRGTWVQGALFSPQPAPPGAGQPQGCFGCSFRTGSHVNQVTVQALAKHILQNCPRFGTWGSSREVCAWKQGWPGTRRGWPPDVHPCPCPKAGPAQGWH